MTPSSTNSTTDAAVCFWPYLPPHLRPQRYATAVAFPSLLCSSVRNVPNILLANTPSHMFGAPEPWQFTPAQHANRALLQCLAQRRLRNLKTELGGVMLPRLLKLVLGGVVKKIVLEAATQKAKGRTVKRQWVLTVEQRACCSVLQRLQRRVALESVCKVLCALWTDIVAIQTASKSRQETSGGADSKEKGMRQRTSAPTMLNCS